MPTVAPDCAASGPGLPGDAAWLPGCPWTFRVAGARSDCPALELYEADDLIDIVSSTRVAVSLLRGARAFSGESDEQALAWGRMPESGNCPQVRFIDRGSRRAGRPAAVAQVTSWCWIAVADGGFGAVTAASPSGLVRCRIARGRPWF
jgi:hypothetical protein